MTLKELLGEVLAVATPPGTLGDLIDELLPGMAEGEVRASVERILKRRVAAQEGRSGSALLARAITKQIDYVAGEAELRGAPREARAELADRLGESAALKLTEAARALADYAPFAAEVARLKASGKDGEDLRQARLAREAQRELVRVGLMGAFLAACGAKE